MRTEDWYLWKCVWCKESFVTEDGYKEVPFCPCCSSDEHVVGGMKINELPEEATHE